MIQKENKPKRKILIIIGTIARGGGAQKVAVSLSNYLADRGYESHLFTFYEAKDKLPYQGVYYTLGEKVNRNRYTKIVRIPLRIWRIYRYAKHHDIDVAFSFLEEANFYTLSARLLFMPWLLVIVSVRNNIRYRDRLFNLVAKYLYPRAYKVVSVTRAVEQILIDDLALTHTTTIYNSLDMDLVERKKQETLPTQYQWIVNHDGPICMSIGRLTHQKAQWRMIRAFTQVLKRHPQAILAILGEGELREQLDHLIQTCNLEGKVFLIGKQPNVYQFLNCADLFVFSSLFEGLPNTMLEALSVGLPIVSADCISGPREIIAPNTGVEQEIAYPYQTVYGTLTQRFSDQQCWQSVDDVPLTPTEEKFAQAITSHITTDFIKGSDYNAYYSRACDFDYYHIMQQWEELLPTLNN